MTKVSKVSMVVVLAAFVAAMPGEAARQNSQTQATGQDIAKPSTLIGCVAQSGGVYRLDHAIAGTDSDVDTQNRPSTEASPTPKMMSYALIGADVKAHLGHKVEVSGTISSDKTAKETAPMKGTADIKPAGTLNVKSVKMVSATCP